MLTHLDVHTPFFALLLKQKGLTMGSPLHYCDKKAPCIFFCKVLSTFYYCMAGHDSTYAKSYLRTIPYQVNILEFPGFQITSLNKKSRNSQIPPHNVFLGFAVHLE